MIVVEEYWVDPETVCVVCGEKAWEKYGRYVVESGFWSEKLGGWVCGVCREFDEVEPQGVVLIYRPKDKVVEKWVVTYSFDEYFIAEVEGDDLEDLEFDYCGEGISPIQFEWHPTDPWRGYYDAEGEGWIKIHEDAILAGSRDAELLERFNDEVKRLLWKLGVEFAVAIGMTSNLFCSTYDILVRREEAEKEEMIAIYAGVLQLALQLAALYRDSDRFVLTALTGKYEYDEKDKLLLEAWRRLNAGEDPEKVQADLDKKLIGG